MPKTERLRLWADVPADSDIAAGVRLALSAGITTSNLVRVAVMAELRRQGFMAAPRV